ITGSGLLGNWPSSAKYSKLILLKLPIIPHSWVAVTTLPGTRRSGWRITVSGAASHTARKGVAIARIARAIAALEPGLALRRGAMVEGLGHGEALHALLQRIVADLLGGIERFLDIAIVEQVGLPGIIGPDAGIAVGLQLDADGIGIGLFLAHGGPALVEFGQHPGDVLDMVAHFMGQHIGLGEIARCTELVAQLVIETEVDIDLLI